MKNHAAAALLHFIWKPGRMVLGIVFLTLLGFLLQSQSPATTASGNTLVSGVVLTPYGDLAPQELEVVILCGLAEVARVQTHGGMFSTDLAGKASPSDMITIAVAPGPQDSSTVDPTTPASAGTGSSALTLPTVLSIGYGRTHGGANLDIQLAKAQNLSVQLQWEGSPFNWASLGPFTDGPPVSWSWITVTPQIFTIGYTCVVTVETPQEDVLPQDYSCTDRH